MNDIKTLQEQVEKLTATLNSQTIRIKTLEDEVKVLKQKTLYLDTKAYKNTLPQTWKSVEGKVVSTLKKVEND